jgi:SufS family cysteine desulfurase
MKNFRSDFAVYDAAPDLVYLDSTATALKPRAVIEETAKFSADSYANIHRGAYPLSESAEIVYDRSKKRTANFINANSPAEIVYSYNATYALNYLSNSLRRSGWVGRGDKILLSMAEHHANVVPWQILAEDTGATIEFVKLDADYDLDFGDFAAKYDASVRVVAMAHVSNVTGKIFSLERLSAMLRDDTYFVVDASQSAPGAFLDVHALDADFAFFTGHKMFAETGLGILYGRESLLRDMRPAFGGGGAINWVSEEGFEAAGLPYRHEPGTPHIQGAASLDAAIRYIESIGGRETMEEIKTGLVAHALRRVETFDHPIELLGPSTVEGRVGILSHVIPDVHIADVAEYLGERNICVRAGLHCAEPLARSCDVRGTVRASFGIYNTIEDIDRFYDTLAEAITALKG